MKLKQYLTLALGIVVGIGVSVAGLSYAAQNKTDNVSLITSQKAKSIMMNKVPGATIVEFSYDGDDRVIKYDGTLIKDNYEYEIDVNAKTGEIIKFEKEKISVSNNNGNNNGNNNDNSNNQGTDNGLTGESNDQTSTTNPSNPNNNQTNNNQTNNNTKPSTSSYIGEAKAKSIMLSKVPGATIRSFYLDNDRTPEYEGKLIKGNMEYEISVDAKTGAIIEFSKEVIEKYDNDRYDNDDDDRYDDDRYDDDDDDDDGYDD